MRGPLDVTRALLGADVPYEIVHLRRRVDDVVELPEALGVPGSACLAVRLYDADDALVAVLHAADTAPASAAVARAARAATARRTPAARVCAATDFNPSLVPPVGLPASVPVLADAALAATEVVYAATGEGRTALKVRTLDLLGVCGARVAALVEPGAVVTLPDAAMTPHA